MTDTALPRAATTRFSRNIAIGVGLAIALTAALSILVASTLMGRLAHDAFIEDARTITELTAAGAGGAVRFGKADQLAAEYAAFLEAHPDTAVALGAWSISGAAVTGVGALPPGAAELARAAIEAQGAAASADGLVQAMAVRFGKENEVVGAVVSAWSDAALTARITEVALLSAAIGAAGALAMALVGWIALRRWLSRPLLQLGGAVDALSRGDEADIPGLERNDEIGALARALRRIHAAGLDARRVRLALDSSSACVLIADSDHRIAFVSSALERLFKTHAAAVKQDAPGLDPGALVGEKLRDLGDALKPALRGLSETRTAALSFGGMQMSITASPVSDDAGTRIGTVMEWSDLTEVLRLQDEIGRAAGAFAEGDFARRVTTDGEGRLGAVGARLNMVGDALSSFVDQVEQAAAAIARGDLVHRIPTGAPGRFGEVAQALDDASAGLSTLVARIQHAETAIRDAVDEVEGGSADLAQRTEVQAGSLGETAASMEEMSASVSGAARNARHASELARQARDRAQDGRSVVDDAVGAMNEIERSSERITDIITVIDSIAFQTNLLALNAAVEAARAGEAGKGFAVVASEVRTLAQRSSEAARDIGAVITESGGKIAEGVGLVHSTGAALGGILDAIEKVANTIDEISEAAREQSEGVEGINQSLSSMDEMTRRNAGLAIQSAEASARLREQAGDLALLMQSFQTDGARAAPRQSAA
ncbi:methyl-accepting chemotaxis protein [Rhodovulum sp. DZ06]|uniref:methyl-accepting chemotaxis protein n=1 Tax=Rhodovulum sp. DZ06 TaxID=3425126 RepID=UPI003D3387C2